MVDETIARMMTGECERTCNNEATKLEVNNVELQLMSKLDMMS